MFLDPLDIDESKSYTSSDSCCSGEGEKNRKDSEDDNAYVSYDLFLCQSCFYFFPFRLTENNDQWQHGYEKVPIVVWSGEYSLSSPCTVISGKIINRWFDSEFEIIQWSIADMKEEVGPNEFGYLSKKSSDEDDD